MLTLSQTQNITKSSSVENNSESNFIEIFPHIVTLELNEIFHGKISYPNYVIELKITTNAALNEKLLTRLGSGLLAEFSTVFPAFFYLMKTLRLFIRSIRIL